MKFKISEFDLKEKSNIHILGIIPLFLKNNLEDKNFFSETKS